MPTTSILEDWADVPQLAADFKVHPRTIIRWQDLPDGLPYAKAPGNKRISHIPTAREWLFNRMKRPNPRI
jgi:hypothetical protein